MDKKILPYSDIKVGMECFDYEMGEYAGVIEFIGTLDEMVNNGYKGDVEDLYNNFTEEELEDCQVQGYQWVIVDPNDIFGPYLANYNCDPSGVVCYKEEKLYTQYEMICLVEKAVKECYSFPENFGTGICFDQSKLNSWFKENIPND